MSRILVSLAVLSLFLCATTAALAESAVVVPQDKAPLKILTYAAEHDTEKDKDLVEHTLKYQNTSDKEVVAARFGFCELNAYGDLLDTFVGYTLEKSNPEEKDKAEFVNEYAKAVFFRKHGTGIVWVDAVRFADGSLWKAERPALLEALKKVKPELTEGDLAEKKSLAAQ